MAIRAPGSGNDRGFALITTILLAFIALALVTTWLTMIIVRGRRATLEQDRMQAEYITRSGLTKAIWYLSGRGETKIDISKPTAWEEDLFTGGRCRMETAFEYGYYKVTCSAQKRGARHQESALFGLNADSLFPEALIVADPRGVILQSGSQVKGDIRSSAPPQNRGADWQGKHVPLGEFPVPDTRSYDQAVLYYQELLANPHKADIELHSPQAFDEDRPLPAERVIYVNDNVLISGRRDDPVLALNGPRTIISTADIQVSGSVSLSGIDLIAAGKISLLDKAKVVNSNLFSTQDIVLRDESIFRGNIVSLMDVHMNDQASIKSGSQVFSAGSPSGNIVLGGRSTVNGAILLCGGAPEQSGVFVGEDARVDGFVFSANRLSIKGSVNGSASAGRMYAPYADSLQGNCLEGSVNRTALIDKCLPVIIGVTRLGLLMRKE